MKLPGSLIVLCIVSVVGIIAWSIFSFSEKIRHDEATPDNEWIPIVDFGETGTVGYVIVEGPSIYFISEKELLDGYGENIQNIKWDELSKSNFMGHPTDSVMFGKPVEAIEDKLKTGDKVKIWYSRILESYPGKIIVENIQKL